MREAKSSARNKHPSELTVIRISENIVGTTSLIRGSGSIVHVSNEREGATGATGAAGVPIPTSYHLPYTPHKSSQTVSLEIWYCGTLTI